MFRDLVDKILTKIIQKQKNRFKINYSFGFVLRNIETQSYRYYHSSHNNAQVLDRAILISNRHDLVNFLNTLSEEDFLETLTRPDCKFHLSFSYSVFSYFISVSATVCYFVTTFFRSAARVVICCNSRTREGEFVFEVYLTYLF